MSLKRGAVYLVSNNDYISANCIASFRIFSGNHVLPDICDSPLATKINPIFVDLMGRGTNSFIRFIDEYITDLARLVADMLLVICASSLGTSMLSDIFTYSAKLLPATSESFIIKLNRFLVTASTIYSA